MKKRNKIHSRKNISKLLKINLANALQDSRGVSNITRNYIAQANKDSSKENLNIFEMYFEVLGFEQSSTLQIMSSYASSCNVELHLASFENNRTNTHDNQEYGIIAKGCRESLDSFFQILESLFANKLLKGNIAEFVLQKLRQNSLSLCVAESCTGGVLSSMITSVNGSSDVYKGGITTYSIESKQNILGIQDSLLQTYSVYSEECVKAMARGAINLFKADIAIATSGLATKDTSKNNFLNIQEGMVFTCVIVRDKLPFIISHNYLQNITDNKQNSRIAIQHLASIESLRLLLSAI